MTIFVFLANTKKTKGGGDTQRETHHHSRARIYTHIHTHEMKRNTGAAGRRSSQNTEGAPTTTTTGKPRAPVAVSSSSSAGLVVPSSGDNVMMMNATTKKYNKTTTTGDATKERHQQWTTKHWLSAVLVPAVFFLSVVVVSNSNYGKSVEEVTALMAEKETLLAQDQNANESDPEASTEEISSRVNVPTEEEEAMEELRSTRESNQMEDEKSDAPRAKRASDTCAYLEQQAGLQYFFKNRCDFDADAMMINPADKSENPERVKLEFIALASYLEGFSYIEHKRISDKKAAEVLRIRAEAETVASYSEGKVDDDQRDTEEHVLEAAIAQSPPPPMVPQNIVEEQEQKEVADSEEEASSEEQIQAAEEQLVYEKEAEKTPKKKKWQFWRKADKKVPTLQASDSDVGSMETMEKAEEAGEQGESTSQVSDSDVGGMETMEKAEEAGEQGESTSQVSDSDVGSMETMEKAEEAGEQGESTSQVSDSDVGGMETMENAEEAGEQGESTLQAPDSDVRTIPPPPPSEVAELREVVKNMASKMDTFVESITEKAEEAGEQGESTSQVSDSDVGTMETMEKAEEAGEQEVSQEESELETINRRMLLKKKKDKEKEAPAPDQTIINQAEPNALVGPKPYKAIVIGKKQAALGLLIARSFKTLQLPAVTEIYEGEPKAFELVVEMTEKEAKEPGAGDVRVKQEVIGNKNGMHDIELSKSKDDARKGLTNRRTMSVPMITGDSLIANTKHEEKTIVLHLGEEHVAEVVKGFKKTLNHGGRIGGPVSTPRIVFFRAKKLKEASDAFKGLPFQVFIVGKPHDETSSSSRPFLMRIDGVRYNKQLDSIKDDMNYLVMALHHNDPYIDVAFSEGATVCDSSCNCFTSSTFRQAAPVCSGHTAHLESYKDHTWRGPKNKAKIRHAHLYGSDGRGGQMLVQHNVESAVLNRLDNFLSKDLPSLDTVGGRDWISEGLKQAEDEANGLGEFAPKVKGKNKKKKKHEDEFTNEYLLKNPLISSGYTWTGGNGYADVGGGSIEKDVREIDFRRKSKRKNSRHIN